MASIGDIDGNGVRDFLVGAPGVDSEFAPFGGGFEGQLWTLMMQSESTVLKISKFSFLSGETTIDSLGLEIQVMEDFNGDGADEILTWALPTFEDIPFQAIKVRQWFKASVNENGSIDDFHLFLQQASLTSLGDINGDGFGDFLGVDQDRKLSLESTSLDVPGVITLFLGDAEGFNFDRKLGLNSDLSSSARFGLRGTVVGDLNGDGIPEIALSGDHEIWIMSLNSDLDIAWTKEISATSLGLAADSRFGRNLTSLDPDGDLAHLIVAAPGRGEVPGSLHLLHFGPSGNVIEHDVIPQSAFPDETLIDLDHHFDLSVEGFDTETGSIDLLLGTPYADIGAENAGGIHMIRLNPDLTVTPLFTISNLSSDLASLGSGFNGLTHLVGDMDGNGYSDLYNGNTFYLLNESANIIGTRPGFGTDVLFPIGDLNGDGIDDVISSDEWPVQSRFPGSAQILFLNREGTIEKIIELADKLGSPMRGLIEDDDRFGQSATRIGDLDGDGVDEFAISAPKLFSGKVWVFFQRVDGTTKKVVRIDIPEGFHTYAAIGIYLAGLGDVNGDGFPDLAIGLPHFGGASDSRAGEGMIQVLLLDGEASVIGRSVTSPKSVNSEIFPFSASLGWLASPGDIDQDGIPDLIVGPANEFSSSVQGIRVLFLNHDGSLRTHRLIDQSHGPLQNLFRSAVSAGKYPQRLWDLDGDGLDEIVIDYLDELTGKRGPMVISLASILGAEILPLAVEPSAPKEGENLQVPAVIRSLGPEALSGAKINFRRAGQASFLTLDMEIVDGANWSAVIPGFLLSQQGIEYYLSASVPGKADHREPANGVISVPVTTSSGVEQIVQSGLAEDGYRLIAVPLELRTTDAITVLEASLGEYDTSSWRFFRVRRNQDELGQVKFPIEPGSAYWMLSAEQRIIDWGIGTSVPTDSVFGIRLLPQWSAFSSPFNFDIDPSLLATKSGQVPDIRRYSGAWQQYSDSTLLPFEGYAIFNGTGSVDTLYIAPSSEIAEISGFFDTGLSKRDGGADWSIPIHARMGRAHDTDNVAVVGPSFLNQADPPPVGDYVRLSFEGNDYPLSTSALSPGAGVKEWTFSVSSKLPGSVTVRFPDLSAVPLEYAVTLVDPAAGIRQNLRTSPRYVLASGGEGSERTLRLEVDSSGFTDDVLPTELALKPAFPNPFSGSTTLSYSLPEASSVELVIFDILGRRIATLEQADRSAGNHVVVWDGSTDQGAFISPGLYIARFRTTCGTQSVTLTKTR